MPVTISARVAPETAERLRAQAAEEERTVSDIVNRALEEYLRAARFPGIVFVTGGSGRRKARLLGGPDVWSVVFVARGYGNDVERVAEHFALPEAKVRLALAYYKAFPDEIDAYLRHLDEVADDPQSVYPMLRVMKVSDLPDAPFA